MACVRFLCWQVRAAAPVPPVQVVRAVQASRRKKHLRVIQIDPENLFVKTVQLVEARRQVHFVEMPFVDDRLQTFWACEVRNGPEPALHLGPIDFWQSHPRIRRLDRRPVPPDPPN